MLAQPDVAATRWPGFNPRINFITHKTISKAAYKILFASSEIYPLLKTGGLADVAQSLPRALDSLNQDVRLVMPAYGSVKQKLPGKKVITSAVIQDLVVLLIETCLPGTKIPVWLVDCPPLFDRPGNPYTGPDGKPWPDNAARFALFSRAIVRMACGKFGLRWKPDILHCNDWQTALAPALLQFEKNRPGIVFTIHNLAYQGVFPYAEFLNLKLPPELWSLEALEFYQQFSFIKGGIIYADQVNTVSPTYAREIQTKKFGAGLNGLLSAYTGKLTGIVNGINLDEWNPETDPYIVTHYNAATINQKTSNKLSLQKELGLQSDTDIPMLATVSRLVKQKGIDLIVEALSVLKRMNMQFVILGSGEKALEDALVQIAAHNPLKVYTRIGYDEALAHKITAAADMFIMPSRFEPCGLNQMYSQYYGTIPIVRKTGGLADTVIDHPATANNKTSNTGIIFETESVQDLLQAILRGLDLYEDKVLWKKMQMNAMHKNFSWGNSALQYLDLYARSLEH